MDYNSHSLRPLVYALLTYVAIIGAIAATVVIVTGHFLLGVW